MTPRRFQMTRQRPWRRDCFDAEYWAAVRAEVDKAPPLSPEIRDRLYELLAPMRAELVTKARLDR